MPTVEPDVDAHGGSPGSGGDAPSVAKRTSQRRGSGPKATGLPPRPPPPPRTRGGAKPSPAPSPAKAKKPTADHAASEGDASADEDAANGEEDLDKERAALMERNRLMLLQLQIPGLVTGLAAEAKAKGGSRADSAGSGSSRRQASQRGVGSKRARDGSADAEPAPRRVSLRVRGVKADEALAAGIDSETAGGVTLVAGARAKAAATGGDREAAEAEDAAKNKPLHVQDELPFRSENGEEASDAAFLSGLQRQVAGAGRKGGEAEAEEPPVKGHPAGGRDVARLGLKEKDVAKVTKDGTTQLAWLPGSQRLLLAAADKRGHVALWDVDAGEGSAAAETDGVLMFRTHDDHVSGMRWLGPEAAVGAHRLITASYDGSLRALDLGGAGTWLRLPLPAAASGAGADTPEWSALEVAADGRTALLGDPQGGLTLLDLRAPAAVEAVKDEGAEAPSAAARAGVVEAAGSATISDRKVNCLHLEPSGGHLLAAASTDAAVRVWDLRRLRGGGSGSGHGGAAKALSVLQHGASCHAAFWAHDGSKRLLSTSFDDTLRLWADPAGPSAADGSGLTQALSMPHNNQTGRWVVPFRAVWSAACDAALCGNMKRGLDVIHLGTGAGGSGSSKSPKKADKAAADAPGKLLAALSSDFLTAIPSRAAPHPTLPVVVASTSSGRCHVFR
ncbi:hypothetical protein HYH03_002596 [Edaphochlamys debaryana]|nr:hypothetical protein HYH03_002596 [Edaphochlamys debaryana]|eukprot:KAG2499658.1 hypothetical protein HYH03_002596 [Edaphochlamys debaryana]